jgi:hypothetical protein
MRFRFAINRSKSFPPYLRYQTSVTTNHVIRLIDSLPPASIAVPPMRETLLYRESGLGPPGSKGRSNYTPSI